MIGLIDGDILVYRIGYSSEDIPERLAWVRLRNYFEEITESLLLSGFTTYLTSSDKSNYRYQIAPDYKGNRTQPKPKHYDFLREQIESRIDFFNSIMVFGKEADDAIGIDASTYSNKKDFIIITVDKDLNQIPGWHYNFVKKKKFYVTKNQGMRYFYHQLLTGDTVDNISGIVGIGNVTADQLLSHCVSESQCFLVVKHIYDATNSTDQMIKRGQLLKIQTKPNEMWQPPEISSKDLSAGVDHLIKVDWRKSFEKFSKIQEKKKLLDMSQSECTSSIPANLDSICQTGSMSNEK